MLSYLSSVSIAILHSLDTVATLLTRCYTQPALREFIDPECYRIRRFSADYIFFFWSFEISEDILKSETYYRSTNHCLIYLVPFR